MSIFKRVVVHHSATGQSSTKAIVRLKHYHLVIDRRGKVFQSLPDSTESTYGTGYYNTGTYNVCLIGNYEHQYLTSKQYFALIQSIVIKMKKLGINDKELYTHNYIGRFRAYRRYITACPGKNVKNIFESIKKKVSSYF